SAFTFCTASFISCILFRKRDLQMISSDIIFLHSSSHHNLISSLDTIFSKPDLNLELRLLYILLSFSFRVNKLSVLKFSHELQTKIFSNSFEKLFRSSSVE